MKKIFLFMMLAASQLVAQAQKPKADTKPDVNDKVHTRIIDGTISTDKYDEQKYDARVLTDKEEVKMKLHYGKHVMLINSPNTPIEDYIFVDNRDKYISHNMPVYIKVPIAANGKLLNALDRKKVLPAIDPKKVKRIVYVNRASAQNKYHDTNLPFGVIEIFY